jgi:glycosyltransferase involved in cell wall biosynthesis
MKVSVCIPTIRPDTIADAIASIRRQTYANWELIVLGQGRQEAIRPVVERAAGADSRVRYIHLDRRGLSIARNRGFDETTGEVVAFTDDD